MIVLRAVAAVFAEVQNFHIEVQAELSGKMIRNMGSEKK